MNTKIRHLLLPAIALMAASGAAGHTSLPEGTPAKAVRSIVVVTRDNQIKHIPLTTGAVNTVTTSVDGTISASDGSGYELTIPMADMARIILSPQDPSSPFKGTEAPAPLELPEAVTVPLGETATVSYPAPDASLLEKTRVYWTLTDPATTCITITPEGEIKALAKGTATINARWASHDRTVKVTVTDAILGDDIPGDANGDGRVDVNDVTATVGHILGQTPANFRFAAADLNGDSTVDVKDITAIVNLILGLQAQ